MPCLSYFILIFTNFNTTYYERGMTLIKQRDKIYKNYMKNNFFSDLSIFLLLLVKSLSINSSCGLNIILYLFMYRYKYTLLKKINSSFDIWLRYPAHFSLFKLIITIITTAHLCGCLFVLTTQYDIENNWIISKDY